MSKTISCYLGCAKQVGPILSCTVAYMSTTQMDLGQMEEICVSPTKMTDSLFLSQCLLNRREDLALAYHLHSTNVSCFKLKSG